MTYKYIYMFLFLSKKKIRVCFGAFFLSSFLSLQGNVDRLINETIDPNKEETYRRPQWRDSGEVVEDPRVYVKSFTKKQAMAFVAYQVLKDEDLQSRLKSLGDFLLWKIALFWAKKIEKALGKKALVSSHQRYEKNAQHFFEALKIIQQKIREGEDNKKVLENLEKSQKFLASYELYSPKNFLFSTFLKEFKKENPVFSLPSL